MSYFKPSKRAKRRNKKPNRFLSKLRKKIAKLRRK